MPFTPSEIYITQEPDNPVLTEFDFIYTEKDGLPPSTYKTAVGVLELFFTSFWVTYEPGVSPNAIPTYLGPTGYIIQNSGTLSDPAGNLITNNMAVLGFLIAVGISNFNVLTIDLDPVLPLQCATKRYVDNRAAGGGTTFPTLVCANSQDIPFLFFDVYTPITFDTTLLDTMSAFDGTYFTTPFGCWYNIDLLANIYFDQTNTSPTEAAFFLYVNVNDVIVKQFDYTYTDNQTMIFGTRRTNTFPVSFKSALYLDAGDKVSITGLFSLVFGSFNDVIFRGGQRNELQIYPMALFGNMRV